MQLHYSYITYLNYSHFLKSVEIIRALLHCAVNVYMNNIDVIGSIARLRHTIYTPAHICVPITPPLADPSSNLDDQPLHGRFYKVELQCMCIISCV